MRITCSCGKVLQVKDELLGKKIKWPGGEVGDAGLVHLEGLKSLKTVDLTGTKVTQEGMDKLKKAVPGASVFKNR
jgi:hypothetical protein